MFVREQTYGPNRPHAVHSHITIQPHGAQNVGNNCSCIDRVMVTRTGVILHHGRVHSPTPGSGRRGHRGQIDTGKKGGLANTNNRQGCS